MRRRVSITVSAMILAAQLGSPLAAAEPSLDQLSEIAELLDDNDVAALRGYLQLNPDLLDGGTELSALLRDFMDDSTNVTKFLAIEPNLRRETRDEPIGSFFEPAAGETPPSAGEPLY